MPQIKSDVEMSDEVVEAERKAIPVRAILTNPPQLEIPGEPVQIAVVVGWVMKELIRQKVDQALTVKPIAEQTKKELDEGAAIRKDEAALRENAEEKIDKQREKRDRIKEKERARVERARVEKEA